MRSFHGRVDGRTRFLCRLLLDDRVVECSNDTEGKYASEKFDDLSVLSQAPDDGMRDKERDALA